jgi:hypothetical protein
MAVAKDAPCIVNALYPFHHGVKKAQILQFLKSLTVTHVAAHIAHQQHHGRAVLEGCVHANGCVGGTRTARNHAHPRAARELAHRLGHIGRAALLPTGDKLNFFPVRVQAVQHSQVALARHAKRVGNALRYQALHQQMARNAGRGMGGRWVGSRMGRNGHPQIVPPICQHCTAKHLTNAQRCFLGDSEFIYSLPPVLQAEPTAGI